MSFLTVNKHTVTSVKRGTIALNRNDKEENILVMQIPFTSFSFQKCNKHFMNSILYLLIYQKTSLNLFHFSNMPAIGSVVFLIYLLSLGEIILT